MALRMGKKVKILRQKTDGRFNFGKIVGVELMEDNMYLGYMNKREYLSRFTVPRYKVAYIDVVTERACTEWFNDNEVE